MRTSKTVPFLAIAVLIFCSTVSCAKEKVRQNQLSQTELAQGWLLLFDGDSLFGLKPVTDANWKATDEMIRVESGTAGLLRTTSQWGNYSLKVDFRLSKKSVGGIFLRTSPIPSDLKTRAIAIRLAGSEAETTEPTGSLIDRQKSVLTEKLSDGWHTLEIRLDGARVTAIIDGKTVLDYLDPEPLGRGYIGLGFEQGPIEFRNFKLKPLGMKTIFNSKDLTGWKTYPEMKSVFSVTEKGEMNVKNGKGQLETADSYGDFTLQLEVFVNGKELNSGIFFRCIPSEAMNGYESQIQNGYKNNDRNQPADCGTGGIFRRTDARRVVADDFVWFRKTIHADGPHIGVWVNGYPVTDWTDSRKANKNPRRGLRLAPGTIQIQGHDPTTDISFRNIRISEVPSRFGKRAASN
jgi:3-keto-disaccharide hydrolase